MATPPKPPRTATAVARFLKSKRRLAEAVQMETDAQIRQVLEDPLRGEPKVGALRGVRVVKFKVGPQQGLLVYRFHASPTSSRGSTWGCMRISIAIFSRTWKRGEAPAFPSERSRSLARPARPARGLTQHRPNSRCTERNARFTARCSGMALAADDARKKKRATSASFGGPPSPR